ncbi:hypothetical protein [Alloactinosynnema sp. L-07]|uniref:hypothetical protein n=1 Tax=Alloactinosynnema sp. L-07 TaxID=1653480 RepID=UPI0012F9768F|nr:hypothetical protein [Alloactinosynnema sp. L-07]
MPLHSRLGPLPPSTPESADPRDAVLAELLARAHVQLQPAVWVDGDVEQREAALTAWFAARLAQARANGQVLVATDPNDERVLGVAVLLERQGTDFLALPDMDTSLLKSATVTRLAALDEQIERTVPCDPHLHLHLHLLAVAVRPTHDDVGLSLLDQVHRYADQWQLPVHTVAWDSRTVATHTRHGWCSRDDVALPAPGGPPVVPMLRQPARTSLLSDIAARATRGAGTA